MLRINAVKASALIALSTTLTLTTLVSTSPADDFDLKRLIERSQSRLENIPKKVLAFYYPWYGTPQTSGRWVHWKQVDAPRRRIANSTHFPVLGAYDSHDPAIVERHIRWAKQAGIDALIASWWQPNDFHDRAFPLLLKTAQQHGIEVTAYFETVPNGKRTQALEDVLYLLEHYGHHPAWLKVGGKPVLFVYTRAVRQIDLSGWLWVTTEVERRFPGGAVFIGDELSAPAAYVFDGIHTYNVTAQTAGRNPGQIRQWADSAFRQIVQIAPRHRIACATVIPGYDDSRLDRPLPRPITVRHDGQTYRMLWEAAIDANPDWVLITSFNEWHEGSQIEPSVEHGDRELKATAHFAAEFKKRPPRSRTLSETGIRQSERKQLAKKLKRQPIGVLPGARSLALFYLASLGADLRPVSWEQLAASPPSPSRMPFLLFAGDETYRASVRRPEDVLGALRRYIEQGGTLVVLPVGPLPFHYDREMSRERVVHHAPQLGLPIRGGWEQPPAGDLRFIKTSPALRHLPGQVPFPAVGDRRWRPLIPGNRPFQPLLELRDASGRNYGLAAAVGRVGNGRVAYVWFRLLEGSTGEALLFDLWDHLAEGTP